MSADTPSQPPKSGTPPGDRIAKVLSRAGIASRREAERMIEAGRACVDLAQQLHAVEKAVCQAKRTLIQDHIDHCLEHALAATEQGDTTALSDFKQITKYL